MSGYVCTIVYNLNFDPERDIVAYIGIDKLGIYYPKEIYLAEIFNDIEVAKKVAANLSMRVKASAVHHTIKKIIICELKLEPVKTIIIPD
jgi:hypothetical protein